MTTRTEAIEEERSWNRMRRLRSSPVLFVFLLAPVLGELLSSSMPIPEFLVGWLPMAVLYGCGALLTREAAIRWGAGWAGIILLGVAYGIYEEGLVARSFFDPEWADLGALGEYGRAGGVNWLWAELLTLFHAAVPIASTLLIADVVFPDRRGIPWLRRRGLMWCAVGLGVWLPLGAIGFMDAGAAPLGVTAIVIGLLVLAAARVRAPILQPGDRSAARPYRFFLAGLAGTAVVFLGIYLPADSYTTDPSSVADWLVTGIGVAIGVALVTVWVVSRSGRFGTWDDRHRVALVWGILGFLSFLTSFAGGPFGLAVGVGTMYAMWRLHRRTRSRMAEGTAA